MKSHFYISALLLGMTACSGESNLDVKGMVSSSSGDADSRFEQSMEYDKMHGVDTISVPDNAYKVYIMTDSHVDFSTSNLDQFVDDYLSDAEAAPFCLHLGDVINGQNHYDMCMEHLAPIWDGTGDTCFFAVGNHDLYFGQWQTYRSYIKTSVYHFVVKTPSFKDLYICLDSGNGTLGVKQRKWLEQLLEAAQEQKYRHIIVFTHTHFFKVDASQGHTSNFALEETHDLCDLFSRYGVELVLQGHDHCRDQHYFKGVQFLIVDALEDHFYNAYYAVMEVHQSFDFQFVPVGPQDPDKFSVRVPGVPHL